MSHQFPPPNQPPGGPFGPPQGGGFPPPGQPPQQGWPPRQFGPGAQGPAHAGNPALGLVIGLVLGVLSAYVYALIIEDAKENDLLGWIGLLIGPVIGFFAGLAGGRSPALPIAGALLGPAAAYFGQILGLCLLLGGGTDKGFDLFFEEFGAVSELWSNHIEEEGKEVVYLLGSAVLGLAAAIVGGRTRSGRAGARY